MQMTIVVPSYLIWHDVYLSLVGTCQHLISSG